MAVVSIDRLTPQQWLDQNWDSDPELPFDQNLLKALRHYSNEGVIPALCYHGCEVEPDGICEHGNPSPLLAWHYV